MMAAPSFAAPRVVQFVAMGTVTTSSPAYGEPLPQIGDPIRIDLTYTVTAAHSVTGARDPSGVVTRTDYLMTAPVAAFGIFSSEAGRFISVHLYPYDQFFLQVGNGTDGVLAPGKVDTLVAWALNGDLVLRFEDSSQTVFPNRSIPQSVDLHDFDRARLEYYQLVDGVRQLVLAATVESMIGGETGTRRIEVGPLGTEAPPAVTRKPSAARSARPSNSQWTATCCSSTPACTAT